MYVVWHQIPFLLQLPLSKILLPHGNESQKVPVKTVACISSYGLVLNWVTDPPWRLAVLGATPPRLRPSRFPFRRFSFERDVMNRSLA